MKVNRLFADDDAVSPVIAVVLMIAIVVILAGIAASFILGFGGSNSPPSPTTQLTTKYVQTDDARTAGFLEIRHGGGESLPSQRTFVRGSGFRDPTGSPGFDPGSYTPGDPNVISSPGRWPAAATNGDDSHVISEDQINVGVNSDYQIEVVYESEDGQNSAILKEDEGPDA